MPSVQPDKSSHLWDQVLDILRTQINPQTFNTWFTPIVFDSCDDACCALTVPNAFFQDYLLDKGTELLHPLIVEVFGAPRQISISIHRTESTSSPNPGPAPFDVLPACRLNAATPQDQWLIENVWMRDAVGILGGPPRAYKSWLALDMAVSVASGTPCLGTFPVPRPGPVLLYAAEDSASSLRARLESITRARHVAFDDLDVRVITADRLRLDQLDDQQRFQATVALHKPQIVILDPLVRIHGADENASNAVAALLGYFRALQRSTGAGILLIHHSRKNPSSGSGYSLRGSSDFYAWTDCLLYLERRRDQHQLVIEHRAAPASGPFQLELIATAGNGPYLQLHPRTPSAEPAAEPERDSLSHSILDLLSKSTHPLTTETIRSRLAVRKQSLLETLRTLSENGTIIRRAQGYLLKSPDSH
jgi:hypothetical protein